MSTPIKDEASGAWVYPEGWTAADREAWEGACGEIVHHEKEAERIAAAGAKALNSPAMVLAIKRIEVDAAKAAKERAERIARGNVAWVNARVAHGERCSRVDGEEGDVIIMVTPDADAVRTAHERADEIVRSIRAGLKNDASEEERLRAEARALTESTEALTDELLKHTVVGGLSATESAARMRALLKGYATLRPFLFALRDQMIRGWREQEGKGFAP